MFVDMDTTAARLDYPLQHCKILHLVRHAQGIHNVEVEKNREAALSPQLFDAQLSPLGRKQVGLLRKKVRADGLPKRVELVITSPMLRTMQTATGLFGEESNSNVLEVTPKTMANGGSNGHSSMSIHNSPPIIAVELCRERMGVNPCDKRRSISEYEPLFPSIDFSLIETDDDILWNADTREDLEDVAARGMNFMEWLWTRQEKEIAIVSHGIFLQQILLALGNELDPSAKTELCKRFKNCELRSLVIIERSSCSMMGSDASTTYPGKIPGALDSRKIPPALNFPGDALIFLYVNSCSMMESDASTTYSGKIPLALDFPGDALTLLYPNSFSMMGSDALTTYPLKIPRALDFSSETLKEYVLGKEMSG